MSDTQIPENCPVWLAVWISRSDTRLGNIEKTLVRLVKRGAHQNNPRSEDSDKVTFKWLVEELFMPVTLIIVGCLLGYVIARGG